MRADLDKPPRFALNLPYEGVGQGGHRAFFVSVPGMLFSMYVGKLISPEARDMCIQTNPDAPMAVSTLVKKKEKSSDEQRLAGARKTKSYEDYIRKLGVQM